MGRSRILILAVAAVSAVALAFIVRGLASQPAPAARAVVAAAPAAKPMARVLVAKHDLGIGARISEEDLHWQPWPADAVNPSFITDGSVAVPQPVANPAAEAMAKAAETATAAKETLLNEVDAPIAALAGAIVKEPIFANEPITDRKLVRSGQSGYMAVVLQPGRRALAIGVSVESGAGGFILPGDRVDIIQSRAGANGSHGTATIMKNVRVLAIDQATAAGADMKAVVGAVATLELTPDDAEFITLAKAQGDLSLSLRSYADVGEPAGRTGARPQITATATAAATTATATATAAAPPSVRIWRGGAVAAN